MPAWLVVALGAWLVALGVGLALPHAAWEERRPGPNSGALPARTAEEQRARIVAENQRPGTSPWLSPQLEEAARRTAPAAAPTVESAAAWYSSEQPLDTTAALADRGRAAAQSG
jgi:hypothetical protein